MKLDIKGVSVSPTITRLVAAVLGTLLLGWAGTRASRAGFERRLELRETEATLATFSEWQRTYQPAAAAESIAWRRTWMALQDLGVVGDERLALTQGVARAAEFAGLRDVRVTIANEPDTTGSDERLSTDGVRRQSAPFGLLVECRGNLQAVVDFLGDLPPSVATTGLTLARQDGRARHRFTLAVYELQFANAPTPVWTPAERRAAGAVGGRRTGG
ncbi:MAG TPA: hypothetical protein VEB19_09250 [Gemmatimonadaceae bacterium]|nr:hypothetical protein [Gemmatimonadaceae bacterium]